MAAEPSRQLQDHCQGEHQGEPDASRARSGTCGGAAGSGVRVRVRAADPRWAGQVRPRDGGASKFPSKVWIQQQNAVGSYRSSVPPPTKLCVTPSLPQACWAELRLPRAHWDQPVGTRGGGLRCEM